MDLTLEGDERSTADKLHFLVEPFRQFLRVRDLLSRGNRNRNRVNSFEFVCRYTN